MKLTTTVKVLLISLGISIPLIAIGVISADPGVLGNAIIISTFIVATPLLIMRYKKYREIKEMEEKFPLFLRDLIEALRAGMPFHRAILSASKIKYGALSKEIKKLADQISWGVTLDKALDQFAERIKKSKRMFLATKIIRESFLTGGDVVSTIDAVVDGQLTLVEAEKEKSSMLNQYVILMYAITLIFIVIVVAINKLMIPIFEISERVGEFGLVNPCATCIGLECNICGIMQSTASNIFSIESTSIAAYYTPLFFFMAIVQSIFSGLVAGQIGEGSITAGIKHSIILVSIVFGTFSILVRLGLLGA